MSAVHVSEARSGRRRCPLCFEPLLPAREARACDACGTAFHPTCFEELGGCTTLGCEHVRVLVRPRVPLRFWVRGVGQSAAIALSAPALFGGVALAGVVAVQHGLGAGLVAFVASCVLVIGAVSGVLRA